jgi:hypothetical protein
LTFSNKIRPLFGSGRHAERHKRKYVDPRIQKDAFSSSNEIPSAMDSKAKFGLSVMGVKKVSAKIESKRSANVNLKYDFVTAKDSLLGPEGTRVAVRGSHLDGGVHQVQVTVEPSIENLRNKPKSLEPEKVHIIAHLLLKPIFANKSENRGHHYEKSFHKKMVDYGLTKAGSRPAGSSAGADAVIYNKITGKDLNIEVKQDTKAALGQLTIAYDPKKGGWHIPDDSRKGRPEYAKHIEKAGILDHMNKKYPQPETIRTTKSGRAPSITIKHSDLSPAKAYLQDHHADIVHIGSHGTYKIGKHDASGHGLPDMEGRGKWTIRDKHLDPNKRTTQFQIDGKYGLDPSHVNIAYDDHLEKFKKSIGY